jgi:hypothetical protein
MIVNSLGQYLSLSVHDHEVGPAGRRKRPVAGMHRSSLAEREWRKWRKVKINLS